MLVGLERDEVAADRTEHLVLVVMQQAGDPGTTGSESHPIITSQQADIGTRTPFEPETPVDDLDVAPSPDGTTQCVIEHNRYVDPVSHSDTLIVGWRRRDERRSASVDVVEDLLYPWRASRRLRGRSS